MDALRPVAAAALVVGFLACGAVTRGTSAAFTAATTIASNGYTVDQLANYFTVAAGTSTQPGTSTPISTGGVDSQTLTFGTVPSARTFSSVFTVQNTTGQAQTAVLTLSGVSQLASAVFTSSGSGTDTIPAGATRTVQVTTSSTVAGHGAGTVRLRLGPYTWMYRDYAASIDLAPEAPATLSAAQRPAGAIHLSWAASATTTNLAGYNVYRKVGAGSYSKLNGSPLAGTTYDDTTTTDGTAYTYIVRGLTSSGVTLESVDSPTAAATADATAPAQPTAVALANGDGTGNAYVNGANASSINVSVTLPASSQATETVRVTLSNGGSSVSGTTAGSSGAGTVTVTGLNATALGDGTITISATSTDVAGNVSNTRTATVSKDTVAPGQPTATYVNNSGNTADQITGAAEANATVTATRTSPTPTQTNSASAAANGSYTVTVAANKNVSVTYIVTATDAAGNTGAARVITAST